MLYSVFHLHLKVTIEKCYILAKVMYEARIDRAAAGREVNMLKQIGKPVRENLFLQQKSSGK